MKLSQLSMLVEVADQGSLKGAAGRVFKTEPAISQGIKQLESRLGIQLFDRSGYRMELTPEGRHIYQRAIRVLNEVSEIEQLSDHFVQGNEEHISLGTEANFDLSLIAAVLHQSQQQFPGTQINFHQEYLSGALQKLINQEVDLCFSPGIDASVYLNETERLPIGASCMVNVISDTLFRQIPALIRSEQLINHCQIVVRDTGDLTRDRVIGAQPGQRQWQVNTFRHKVQLIRDGLGWGRVPEHTVKSCLDDGSLVLLDLEDMDCRTEIPLYAFRLKKRVPGPVASALWQWLSQSQSNEDVRDAGAT